SRCARAATPGSTWPAARPHSTAPRSAKATARPSATRCPSPSTACATPRCWCSTSREERRVKTAACAVFAAWGLLVGVAPARADVTVAALIGDHMVVQQGRPVHVWGTAAPGEEVTASLAGHTARGRAGADGAFSLHLPALKAGGPHTLTVRGKNTLTFTDVWAGEVWVGSGQSNMEFPLVRATSAAEAATGCAGLHLF